ncbi:MAG: OB-fold nucleic acid binding domain-containing protein [Candidatus Aenigmatarchaeota archaeon]
MEKKRSVAKKVRICDLVNGLFVHGSKNEMKPSYVITPFGEKISRVNLVATVTDMFLSEDGNYGSITIDDGTACIRVKLFGKDNQLLQKISRGDLVIVIGKVKEYDGEIYVLGEILRKLEDPNFEVLRKLEILKEMKIKMVMIEEIKNLLNELSEEELKKHAEKYGLEEESLNFLKENLRISEKIDYKPRILELISSLDKGEGVEVSKIFEVVKLPERIVENAIDELLSSGDLFEPKPGILKRVER